MSLLFDAGLMPTKCVRAKKQRLCPSVPDTGWEPVKDFPNLSAAKAISLDVETFDPHLLLRGPGWGRCDGHMVGASLCTEDGKGFYLPFRHEFSPEQNLDPEAVLRYLKDTLVNPAQPKIGANLVYDLGWLRQEGVVVCGKLYDVEYAEALLDESSRVSLEVLGQKYTGRGKESNLMYQWLADYYGGKPGGEQRANIYRCPPTLVGHYAESDAYLPFEVIKAQWPLLRQEGLLDLFELECSLIPLYLEMRFAGVKVDLKRAEELYDILEKEKETAMGKIYAMSGVHPDMWSADSISQVFTKMDIPFKRLATGNPSFTSVFLEHLDHPVGAAIRDYRQSDKLQSTFIKSYIFDSHINGRIYCQFHPLRNDSGGARSGRFSSSNPNLQNIPARTALGKKLRSMFIPDDGSNEWIKYDYSQIEYRFLAHFAVGDGSDALRATYNANPDTDFHEALRQQIKVITGLLLERKPTKTVNFGLMYGMGKEKLCNSLGITVEDGEELFAAYHMGAPFVKETMNYYSNMATTTGSVRTFLGRKSRFDAWGSKRFVKGAMGMSYATAVEMYGGEENVKRMYSHKGLNRVLQGSSADQLKTALHRCYYDGLFDVVGVPSILVHDEMNFSSDGTKKEAFAEIKNVMETCLKLRVPVRAGMDVGPNWGDLKEVA